MNTSVEYAQHVHTSLVQGTDLGSINGKQSGVRCDLYLLKKACMAAHLSIAVSVVSSEMPYLVGVYLCKYFPYLTAQLYRKMQKLRMSINISLFTSQAIHMFDLDVYSSIVTS